MCGGKVGLVDKNVKELMQYYIATVPCESKLHQGRLILMKIISISSHRVWNSKYIYGIIVMT